MTAQERGLEFRFPFRGRVMADALVTDQEIAILCDVMEGWGANLNADKRKVLDQLMLCRLTESRLQNTNLPAKLNNFSPSAALD